MAISKDLFDVSPISQKIHAVATIINWSLRKSSRNILEDELHILFLHRSLMSIFFLISREMYRGMNELSHFKNF